MINNRISFLSSVFVVSSTFAMSPDTINNDILETWQQTYLNHMSPEELQLTANFLYLSYAIALAESKIRQFSIPITRLNQAIRTNVATYKNTGNDLATLKTLFDRLSYITGARSIYTETLTTCTTYYTQHTTPTINAALESIQLDAQTTLRIWADEKNDGMTTQLTKSASCLAESAQYFQIISGLHKGMSEGTMPMEISPENAHNKSLFVFDIILNNNDNLLAATENITNALNETYDHAAHIIAAGAEIYKQYYKTIYNVITAPTSDKHYATTMFSMHGILSQEYETLLPDPDHVFEHMLQTTKLYTQTELLHQS